MLEQIARTYSQPQFQDVILGIEVLNEPLGPALNLDQLRDFYRDAYSAIRQSTQDETIIFHDAFQSPSFYNGFLSPSDNGSYNVALDHHEYQVFDDAQLAWTPAQHCQNVCTNANSWSGADKWSFIGEWTAAMTDCAPNLRGYGVGARYDGTDSGSSRHGSCSALNNISAWSQQQREDTRAYIEIQMDTFERMSDGWAFWTLKTEGAAEWDLYELMAHDVFPQPLTARTSGAQCTAYA